MLSEIQKSKFTPKAKEVAQALLKELRITKFDDDAICAFQEKLDLKVAALVSMQEEGELIDDKLLETYDLLVDIILDNEENLDFLNLLFFH